MLVTWDDRKLDCGVDDEVFLKVLWCNVFWKGVPY